MGIVGAHDIWLVDGVDLRTHAWNVEAVPSGQGLPPRRGDNVRVPFRHGARAYAKYYDQRQLTLSMFVVGCDPEDGGVPAGDAEKLAKLYANLDALRQVFGRTDRLLELTHVLPGGERRTAQAEVAGTMDFDSVGGALARFAVDLTMPDPFWYGAEQATRAWWGPPAYGMSMYHYSLDWYYGEGHLYGTPWAPPQTLVVNHPGTYATSNLVIMVQGICETPRVTHANGTWVEVAVAMELGDELVIDCDAFTCKLNGASVIGSLRHQGSVPFFELFPGDNELTLTSDVTPRAAVTVTFAPTYL